MNTCALCGWENGDEAMHCIECGSTDFRKTKAPTARTAPPPLPSAFSQAITLPAGGQSILDFEALKPDEINNTWVTLMRCRTLVEADLIATRLQAAEIPVFIPDEFLMQAISWAVNTYGFVRLRVPPSKYQAARAALEE
jgi:hypothetical protein